MRALTSCPRAACNAAKVGYSNSALVLIAMLSKRVRSPALGQSCCERGTPSCQQQGLAGHGILLSVPGAHHLKCVHKHAPCIGKAQARVLCQPLPEQCHMQPDAARQSHP